MTREETTSFLNRSIRLTSSPAPGSLLTPENPAREFSLCYVSAFRVSSIDRYPRGILTTRFARFVPEKSSRIFVLPLPFAIPPPSSYSIAIPRINSRFVDEKLRRELAAPSLLAFSSCAKLRIAIPRFDHRGFRGISLATFARVARRIGISRSLFVARFSSNFFHAETRWNCPSIIVIVTKE